MESFKNKKIIVKDKAKRLDAYLASILSTQDETITRSKIQKMIEKGAVIVNGKSAKAAQALDCGDVVEFTDYCDSFKITPENIDLDIKFEDKNLLVINKPKNMLSHPTSYDSAHTLVNALLEHCRDNLSSIGGDFRRGIVHRLDKDTAGLMLCAKTDEAHIALSEQIKNKSAVRKYLAICYGEFENPCGTIDLPLCHSYSNSVKMKVCSLCDKGAMQAITHYKVIKQFQGAALVELQLETGRTHQIRAHLSHLNHPVAGDNLYGAKGFRHNILSKIKTNNQVLQSYFLSFTHPVSCAKMEFKLQKCDFDADFIKVLNALEGGENG